MQERAQDRRSRVIKDEPAFLAERIEQAEQAAGEADCLEAMQAHAVMALHYRARLQEIA